MSAANKANPDNLMTGSFIVNEDITNQIAGIKDNQGHVLFSANFDPAGRLLAMASGNYLGGSAPSLSTALTYDSFGRKATVTHSEASSKN